MNRNEWADLLGNGPIYGEVVDGPHKGSLGVITSFDNGSGKLIRMRNEIPSRFDGDRPPKKLRLRANDGNRSRMINARTIWVNVLPPGSYEHRFVEDKTTIPDIPDMLDHALQPGNVIAYAGGSSMVICTVTRISNTGQVYVRDLLDSSGKEVKGEERRIHSNLSAGNFIIFREEMMDQLMLLKLAGK